jgi:hypothetical protein
MHGLVSNLMAALVGIHAVLGCGLHHAHECEECVPSSTQVARAPTCCHHQQDASPCDESAPTPCKCFLECHDVCAFLPTSKTQVELPALVVPFESALTVSAISSLQAASCSSSEFSHGNAALAPPLRLHLLHQILLI